MNKPNNKNHQPLPKDKPESYGNVKTHSTKGTKSTATRLDKGKTKIKSENDSPQKAREKTEYDPQKREEDPGMTKS